MKQKKERTIQDLMDYAADLAYQAIGFSGKPKK
jgi:hypothetical protein